MSEPASQPGVQRFEIAVEPGSREGFDSLQSAASPLLGIDALDRSERDQFRFHSVYYEFGSFGFATTEIGGWAAERERKRIARTGTDNVFVNMFLSGESAFELDGVDPEYRQRDILITCGDRPGKSRSRFHSTLTLKMERSLLSSLCRDPDLCHGILLRHGTPLNGLIGAHMVELKRQVSQLTGAEAVGVGKATAALLAACAGASNEGAEAVAKSLAEAGRRRLCAVIEQNLADPTLGPDRLMRLCGLSRSALYRLAEPLDGVASYIRERRLARARDELCRLDLAGERIASVAYRWGFGDLSSFGRAFKTRFGITPGEMREGIQVSAAAAAPDDHRGDAFDALNTWLAGSRR